MSLTLRQSPGLWTPGYNPMYFVLDSTNTAQDNFRYIADIYISGSSGRQLRMPASASAVYSQGIFDVSRVLESYFGSINSSINTFDIDRTTNGFGLASNSMIAYEVKFGEQYGNVSALTTYPDLVVTGTKYAFNGAYSTHDWLNFNGSNIAIEDSQSLLNDMVSPQQYSFANAQTNRYLHYITNISGGVYFAEIKTYDSSGSLIQTSKIENAYQAVASYNHRRQFFNAGIRSLNNATLYSGSQPVLSDSVSYYTVQFTDWAGAGIFVSPFRFNNDQTCYAGRTPISLHWLNSRGAFDSYEFTMVNRYKSTKKTDTYRRKLGTESENAYGYTAADAGLVVSDTRQQSKWELQADWIDVSNTAIIHELLMSPVVFIDIGTTQYRVTVTSPSEAEIKASSYGDIELSNVKIIAEISQEYHRQRA